MSYCNHFGHQGQACPNYVPTPLERDTKRIADALESILAARGEAAGGEAVEIIMHERAHGIAMSELAEKYRRELDDLYRRIGRLVSTDRIIEPDQLAELLPDAEGKAE